MALLLPVQGFEGQCELTALCLFVVLPFLHKLFRNLEIGLNVYLSYQGPFSHVINFFNLASKVREAL